MGSWVRPGGNFRATVSVVVACGILFGVLASTIPSQAATVAYTLYGETGGWGFSPATISSPGPTLYADQGDTVDLTLTGIDGPRHNWMLDYNANRGWDAGEPRSADFQGTTITYSFVANRAGTFPYICEYHANNMVGTFIINATGNAPPTVSLSYPNGGLAWTGGSAHTLRWNMSDATDPDTSLVVFLNYTYNAGANGGGIAGPLSGFVDPSSFAWSVPPIEATDLRVNITVIDTGGAKGYDERPVPRVDSTAPNVVSTTPADGAVGVSPGTWINVTFSEPMSRAATEAAVELRELPTWALVPTAVVGWTGNVLTVRPTAPLATDTAYQANVSIAAKDASDPGNPLASPVIVRFLTVNAPPVVTILVPAGGERWTGGTMHTVSWVASDAETPCAGLTIDLEYSPTGGAPWFLIAPGLSGCSGAFPWLVPLLDSENVVVRATVRDGRGDTSTDVSGTFAIDSSPPAVTLGQPTGAGVVTNANVVVTFTERMNETATASSMTLGLRNDGTLAWIVGAFSWDPAKTVLTFDPVAFLDPGTSYTAFVNATAEDASDPGNPMAAPISWSFTTGSGADSEPPQIVAAQAAPDPQEAGLPVNVTATVVDNVAVAMVSVRVTDPFGSSTNTTMAFAGADVWFLEGPYAIVGTYTFAVWAVDLAGNGNGTSGQFTVRDTTPPTVSDVRAVPDPAEVPATVNVSAVAQDNAGIAQVSFDVSGVGNLTASFDVGGGRYFARPSVTVPGTYPVAAWACDLGGLCAVANGQFVARDTTPPVISAVRVLPPGPEVNASARIEAVVSDNYGVAGVSVDIPSIGNLTMAWDPVAGAYAVSRSFSPMGMYAYTVWAQDLVGLSAPWVDSFQVADTTPPVIEHTPLGPVPPEQPIVLSARITDNDWVASAQIAYVGVTGDAHLEPLARGGLDTFGFDMPGQLCEGTVRYNLTATDAAGNSASSAEFAVTVSGASSAVCLSGDTIQGWGLSPDALSKPGPTLTYDLGDTVTIVVIGVDAVPHYWYVDYDGDGSESAGEPTSAVVRGNATVLTFPADRAGRFTYYCGYHQSTMYGTFVVRGAGEGGPGAFPWEWVALLAVIGIVLAVIVVLRRRRRKPSASETTKKAPKPEP